MMGMNSPVWVIHGRMIDAERFMIVSKLQCISAMGKQHVHPIHSLLGVIVSQDGEICKKKSIKSKESAIFTWYTKHKEEKRSDS